MGRHHVPGALVAGLPHKGSTATAGQPPAEPKAPGRQAIDNSIVERPYQHNAIRAVTEAYEQDFERKALVVMATGTGKTRTVVALAKLLQESNWAKRVLFLVDRVALVKQAANAFRRTCRVPVLSFWAQVTKRTAASTWPLIRP